MSKKCSYDVCLAPVTNVVIGDIADPRHPTEEEIEKIVTAASDNIIKLAYEKLSSENLEFIELYEEDIDDGPLDTPVRIFDATPTAEQAKNRPKKMLNRIELAGVIGRVLVENAGGKKVANFSVVTDYFYKDRDGKAVVETTWHQATYWEGTGKCEIEKITKGAFVHLSGRLVCRRYVSESGEPRTEYRVIVKDIYVEDEENVGLK